VREQRLYELAAALALGEHLRLGEGELKSGGFRRPSILADALEALIGAVFVDGGFLAAREVVLRLYQPLLERAAEAAVEKDPKTQLQEWLQSRRLALPQYSVRATSGAAHEQRFEVECLVREFDLRTTGTGTSRRLAEQEAARAAFERLPR
jgi:ribonuclease-3